MKNNSRKNRPSVGRPQRGRSIPADGIYSNYLFLHAAASHVGNVVYVQTKSGDTYEGIFRTFSPQFQIALEVAHRTDYNPNEEEQKIVESVVDTLIFKPQDIVTICAKNVDLDYATRDTFQTDTSISRCNGNLRGEERELEPWDPSGGLTNGDCDLELDSNANGWNAHEMFQKNESIYGVQSTFDHSLSGYTVKLEKANTKEFKDQEAEAEKIANEIENNPLYKERVDLENGDEDEEAKFSAVIRADTPPQQQSAVVPQQPAERQQNNYRDRSEYVPRNDRQDRENHITERGGGQGVNQSSSSSPPHHQQSGSRDHYSQPPPQQQQGQQMPNQQQMNSIHSQATSNNAMNSNTNVPAPAPKYVPPSKRKPGMNTGKLVRSTPPPPSNSGPPTPQSPQAPPQQQQQQQNKQNNYPQMMQQQQQQQHGGGPQYMTHTQIYPPTVHNQNQNKMNGDQNQGNQNNQGNVGQGNNKQQQQQQRPYQRYQNPNPNVSAPPPNIPPPVNKIQQQQQQQQMHKPMHVQHIMQVPPPMVPSEAQQHVVQHVLIHTPTQTQMPPPPQPQRQPRSRDDLTQDFRKFQYNFKLQDQQQQQQQQQQDNELSQQQAPPPQQQNKGQQRGGANPNIPDSVAQNQGVVPQQIQQQPPPSSVNISNNSNANNNNSNNSNSNNLVSNNTGNNSSNETTNADKSTAPGGVAKKFVLNPAAKPFTPRSPSTPNPSRVSSSPHTPQTPSPAVQTPVSYAPQHTSGPHIAMTAHGQPQMIAMPTYVVQQPPQFQTQHPQPRQHKRLQQVQVQTSPAPIQVAAATGPPLLASTPSVQLMYPQLPPPQHFQQPYATQMMRVAYDTSQQPIQYLAATPPSTTPSPGQPQQQYHPGPQPSPAGGQPGSYSAAPQQAQQMSVVYPLITGAPQLMHQFYQQPGHHQTQPIQVIMHQQHPAAPQ